MRPYDAAEVAAFYDLYGRNEWDRLEATAYGRLKAVMHADFLRRFIRPGDRVLDAGCGPGRFTIELAEIGARLVALDVSPGQLRLARESVERAGLVAAVEEFVVGDIADLSRLADASFDAVVCYGGALSYVCERRQEAAAELMRVVKPGGRLIASVMSRYGAAANVVSRPSVDILREPEANYLEEVLATGDLPGTPSRNVGRLHPPMHLYGAAELVGLFGPGCQALALAGSNVTCREGSEAIEAIAADEAAWGTAVELERRLCEVPGLVDSGIHIIIAVQKAAPA